MVSTALYARLPNSCYHPSKPDLGNCDVFQDALFSLLYFDCVFFVCLFTDCWFCLCVGGGAGRGVCLFVFCFFCFHWHLVWWPFFSSLDWKDWKIPICVIVYSKFVSSQNHGMACDGRDLKDHLVTIPSHGQFAILQTWLPKGPSNLALSTSTDWTSTASLGNLFMWFITDPCHN